MSRMTRLALLGFITVAGLASGCKSSSGCSSCSAQAETPKVLTGARETAQIAKVHNDHAIQPAAAFLPIDDCNA